MMSGAEGWGGGLPKKLFFRKRGGGAGVRQKVILHDEGGGVVNQKKILYDKGEGRDFKKVYLFSLNCGKCVFYYYFKGY